MAIPHSLLNWGRTMNRGLTRRSPDRGRIVKSWAKRQGADRSLSSGEEGGALVEVALTVPVLLAVLTGIISFGIAYGNQLTLTQAVGSAGQYLSQIRTSTTDPCADTFKALKNAAPNLDSSKITMTVTINGTSNTGTSCTSMQTTLIQAQGSPVSVFATYPCGLAIYGVNFAGSCNMAAKVTEYEY